MSQRERYEQGGIGRWYWDFRDRAMLSMIPEGKTLDAGCGEMITTRKIPGCIGMDMDNGDVRGSVYDLPFKPETFDNVLFSEVIEHLPRPFEAIEEIWRVLKKHGLIIVVFPHDAVFNVAWTLCGMWGEVTRDRGHLRRWSPCTAGAALEYCGFTIRGSTSIPFFIWPLSLHHIIVGEKC